MWIDIVILAIFLLCVIGGIRKGFVLSLTELAGSLGAFFAGYFLCDDLSLWVRENTGLYEKLYDLVAPYLEKGTAEAVASFLDQMPAALADLVETSAEDLALTLAETAANVLLSVLCFLTIVVAVRLALFLITLLFSKRYRGGLTGATDGVLGLAFGVLEGAFLVFLFLALLLPVTEILGVSGVIETLEASRIGGFLYDNNLLFLLAEKILVGLPAGL